MREGVKQFLTAFAGTPTKIKLVPFDTKATTLGSGAAWSRYFNMLDQGDVDALLAPTTGLVYTGLADNPNGNTNWEDALFRTFYNQDGTVDPVLPGLVVFFTDGVPTYDRMNASSSTAPATRDLLKYPAAWPNPRGLGPDNYNQEAFDRADTIARQFRDSDGRRLIGVGVGDAISNPQPFVNSIGAGYHLSSFMRWYHIERSFHNQKGFTYAGYQRGYHVDTSFHYQKGFTYTGYQRGYNVERSFHDQKGFTWATYQRGYHTTNGKYYFSTPFNSWVTVSLGAKIIPDGSSSLTAGSSGNTNLQQYVAQNVSQTDSTGNSTDGWVGSGSKTYVSSASAASDWEN